MKIIDRNPDGSIRAEREFHDGDVAHTLDVARRFAALHRTIVHFDWNGWAIAVAVDSDLDLIMRAWEAAQTNGANPTDEIGPYPDPTTTPPAMHGTFVLRFRE